jgi:cell division protein FtsW
VKPKRHQFEWNLLVLVTTALVLFGLVMVYSATSGSAALGNANPLGFVEKQVTYAVIGAALLVVVSRLPLERLRALAPTLVVTALILCLGVLAVGARINGARRWIAKLAVVVWTAAYLSRRAPPRTLPELARPLGILVLVFAGLVLVEPDLGTALTLLLVVGAVLLVSGTRMRLLASAYGLVFGLAAIAAWSSPYRRDRLLTFLDPWKDPTGAGLQNVQALISFGSGGIFGRGLGSGLAPLYYLPEAHTDMMFAVVGEELGLVGVTLVLMAFCAFGYAGIRLAIACRDPFAKRLAAGVTALVCGQAAINMAACVGLAPLTGIPLPFVSYGGSSLVVMLVGVGVLLNIARDGGRAAAAVPDRGRRDGGTRRAGARRRGSVATAGRARDVRRVAGSRRGAARS